MRDASRKRGYRRGLDGLLLLNVGVLPVLLFWPPMERGHDPLRPGAQVCRQYPAPGEGLAGAARPPLHYLVYLPAEYTDSRRWPLVVFLHGGGGRTGRRGGNLLYVRAEGLPNQIERGKQFPFILVSPQSGSAWRPAVVVELIDHLLLSLPVDPDRVYLTGNSMGGIGTWQVAAHFPERFAAIVPLCGAGDVRLAGELVNMPIWAFHGALDDRVPLGAGRAMVDAVNSRGGHARLTVYPEAGHFINDVTYETGNSTRGCWPSGEPHRNSMRRRGKEASPLQSQSSKK